jgi:Ras-related protein Rab-1A
MADPSCDYLLKILIVGESGVGKSNILLRFVENSFVASHMSTIGVDFKLKTIRVGKLNVKL